MLIRKRILKECKNCSLFKAVFYDQFFQNQGHLHDNKLQTEWHEAKCNGAVNVIHHLTACED